MQKIRAVRLGEVGGPIYFAGRTKKLLVLRDSPIISPDIIQFASCLLYVRFNFRRMPVTGRQLAKQDMHHPSAGKLGSKRTSSPERQLSKG